MASLRVQSLLRSPRSHRILFGNHADTRLVCPRRRLNLTTYPVSRFRRYNHTTSHRFAATSESPQASSSQSNHEPNLSQSRFRRFVTTTTLILVFFTAGFAMTAAPAIPTANGILNPPTNAETLELFKPATPTSAEIHTHIRNHPLAQKLRAEGTWTESVAHEKIPAALRQHNLTAGVLQGEGRLEVPPLGFNENSAPLPRMVQFFYLGTDLCGHAGIIHGGMLATMLDEGLARACFPALPNKVAVTASLKIDYRKPCPAGKYVGLKAETTKVEGRKAWVKGHIELLGEEDGDGTVVAEAEGLFIEPKNASSLPKTYTSG